MRTPSQFVAGVDGCHAGWIAFKVELPSLGTSVEVIDLPALLTNRPSDLSCVAIDIPTGLLNGPRACDKAARRKLGQARGTSVFPAPCRAVVQAETYEEASAVNRHKTDKGLSKQAWGIAKKIKQVDDAIMPDRQRWAFEVHPEVCFWALNQHRPMANNKKTEPGRNKRLKLLRTEFPHIQWHLVDDRPLGVAKDDLLDAAAAARTALRRYRGIDECVGSPTTCW